MANSNVAATSTSALNFMSTLQAQQNTAFQGNQTALNAVQGAWGNILAGGAIPPGYSAGLDSMLQTNIRNNAATGDVNAKNAAALEAKQAGGGALAPAGETAAVNAQIDAGSNASLNSNLTAEKTADYQQGVTNLEAGSQAELGVAGAESDVGLAGASTGSGALSSSAGQAQWQENQTSSPAAILGDIGSAAGDAGAIFG
jgi:hypothetical protein